MMQGLNYIRRWDYDISDTRLSEKNRPIGRWGRMYRDYIKEYFQDFSSIADTYHPVCIEAIGSRYAVMHLAGDTSMQNILSDYNISMLPGTELP